jgi:hypothetical protein
MAIIALLSGWRFSTPLHDSLDQNINDEDARRMINAFQERYSNQNNPLPKGYFLSRAAINWMLDDPNKNGIYIYNADDKGRFCTVVEPGISRNASFRVNENVHSRIVITESMCPTDCGSLAN